MGYFPFKLLKSQIFLRFSFFYELYSFVSLYNLAMLYEEGQIIEAEIIVLLYSLEGNILG